MKYGMKILIHSQTSTVQPLKFGIGTVISSRTLLDMWLLIHTEIKVKGMLLKGGLGMVTEYKQFNWYNKHESVL